MFRAIPQSTLGSVWVTKKRVVECGGTWPDVAECGADIQLSQRVDVVRCGDMWRPVAIFGPNHNPRVGGSSPSSATKTSFLCQIDKPNFRTLEAANSRSG